MYNPKYIQYPVSTKIVLHTVDRFLRKGYCVTTDNFYLSPQLADILGTEKIDSYRTVNKTRKDLPNNFLKEKVPQGGKHTCDCRNKKLVENFIPHACMVDWLSCLRNILCFFHKITTWKFLVSCCTKHSNRHITLSK